MKNYNKILEAVNRGIKFALDDFEDQDDIQGQTSSKVKYKGGTKEWLDLMNEVVDLGLPSGTLWCKYNLDVNPNQLSKAEDWYGKYYAWGELEGNKIDKNGDVYFDWRNYKFGKNYDQLTKYCSNSESGLKHFIDNLTQLLPEDDAASQNKKFYNYKFHIPTKEQFEELINYTHNYWVNNYDPNSMVHHVTDNGGIKGLNGRVFIGQNRNQLFIPAAGFCNGFSIDDVDYGCYLWSSNLYLDSPNFAYGLDVYSDDIIMSNNNRYRGFSIRPVINL